MVLIGIKSLIMKKIIIYIVISFIVISAKAQHITYADFMKLVKIEQWSAINDAIYPKGYRFAGSKTYYEKTDSAYFEAVWCKNCTYDFYSKSFNWENNVQRSLLCITIRKSVEFQYIFTGKQAFSTFMNTAKANGFKYSSEGIYSKYISVWYKRSNKQKNYDEWMLFNEYTDKFEVNVRGEIISDLTRREFEVLKFLAQRPGQIVTRETLLEKVWGYEYYGDIRTVDVTIRRIREKIEKNTSNPKILITKRGIGYYISNK